MLASDIPNALRMPAQGLLGGQVSHLYAAMHGLSRGSGLVGLPLQEWISLVRGLDSDVPAKEQLEALLLKALSVGTRYELVCIEKFAIDAIMVISTLFYTYQVYTQCFYRYSSRSLMHMCLFPLINSIMCNTQNVLVVPCL